MPLIFVFVVAMFWLVVSGIGCWFGVDWVLAKTTLDVLTDPAIKMIIQILVVVFGAPTIAGVMTYISMFVVAFGGALFSKD